MAVVFRDECGLLVKAMSKIILASFCYEAETQDVEWTVTLATGEDWRKFLFSSDASQVGGEINSGKDLGGWYTRDLVLKSRNLLMQND